jgi:hypothetical protein
VTLSSDARPALGHNGGPSLDEGLSWRRHCWSRARERLLPTLPIEVVRLRVARARDLGLPYRTYAGLRASSGQDVIGFLFSTNALRLLRPTDRVPRERQDRLASLVACDRVALAQLPLDLPAVLSLAPLDAAHRAPLSTGTWGETRDRLRAILRDRRRPGDAYVLIGETGLEREWCEAGRLAGFLPGDAYFAPLP